MDSFKLWIEAKIEKDLATDMVLNDAGVSHEGLVNRVGAHRSALQKLLSRGNIESNPGLRDKVDQFIEKDQGTLNDLVNFIVTNSSNEMEDRTQPTEEPESESPELGV